ncbi:D-amino acid dehydrogenase [Ramlibacter sp. AN1015]|uniref:D-amino acid dehydrogenase n=1 Tax=Ramlibacter sp. AN1015 TaxID=3133428 RepID=UPI0030BD3808
MHVLVLGSGVIGTSVAYYAARQGHAVTVIDRQPGAGLETSFANAGEVSPGYAAPWAGPGVPLKAIKWLLMPHGPLAVRPSLDPLMWRWIFLMLANCTRHRYAVNKSRMVRLAQYSRDCLQALRTETGIGYDERMLGTVQLFRTQRQLDRAALDLAVLQEQGVPHELLDRDGVIGHEPALAATRDKFVGALRLPGDETGDCFTFTRALANMAAALGVQFRFGVAARALAWDGQRVQGIHTDEGVLRADATVVAAGSYAGALLRPLGLRLPVYPVKGYSLTLPIVDPAGAPESTVMDETYKVAITRLGGRIRVGGMAELAGFDLSLPPGRRATLEHVVGDLFPGGGDLRHAGFWCGLRPMTPDGTPVVGPTPVAGLHLAIGHGTLGWTMAAGTGRLVADLLSLRVAEIDTEGLGVERFLRRGPGRATRVPAAARTPPTRLDA